LDSEVETPVTSVGALPPVAPRVPLDPGEKLLAVLEEDLNHERTDEQILVTKLQSDAKGRLRVTVAEYDTVTQAFRRSWEGMTQATDERYFSVQTTLDVLGDHSPPIVFRGSASENRTTMDIFRKAISAGTRLTYTPVFSAVSTGDIDIRVEARSQAYLAGDADGQPFAIVVTEPDPASPTSDIVKTTHHWSTRDKRYVATAPVRIEGKAVERERLAALFSGNSAQAYLEFLRGPWILANESGEDTSSFVGNLMYFSPTERLFQIYSASNSTLEEYRWEKADAYYRNVTIRSARNTILADITKEVRISVESLDEIRVTVESTIDRTDVWRATFRRVNEAALTDQMNAARTVSTPTQPMGLYEGQDGDQIVFQPPRFTWIGRREASSGGFYLYELDRLVLGLLVQKGYNERPEERSYIAEQSTLVEANRVVRTLVLQPAELTVWGARPTSEEKLTFTQVQASTEAAPP
jgi:hypothetical protein